MLAGSDRGHPRWPAWPALKWSGCRTPGDAATDAGHSSSCFPLQAVMYDVSMFTSVTWEENNASPTSLTVAYSFILNVF